MRQRFYSLSCGVEYIEVPKCACTSIKIALGQSDGADLMDYPHSAARWRRCPGDFVPCAVFTFVRHPVERLKSAWRQKLQTGLARRLGGACPLPVTATFAEFTQWVTRHGPHAVDKHWRPQSFLLAQNKIDFIGRMERIDQDWQRLRDEFGLPELPHLTRSFETKPEPVDDATRKLIASFYAMDFEAFGYEP